MYFWVIPPVREGGQLGPLSLLCLCLPTAPQNTTQMPGRSPDTAKQAPLCQHLAFCTPDITFFPISCFSKLFLEIQWLSLASLEPWSSAGSHLLPPLPVTAPRLMAGLSPGTPTGTSPSHVGDRLKGCMKLLGSSEVKIWDSANISRP